RTSRPSPPESIAACAVPVPRRTIAVAAKGRARTRRHAPADRTMPPSYARAEGLRCSSLDPLSEATMPPVRLGALCWNQYADWRSLLEAGRRVDRLGYDSLWTWDHVYPIVGSHEGPMFEGWLTITAWAQATERVRIGLMVVANTFRNPALTAKMATTLDHISGGRAILGVGAAWFETEHEAFGIEFGSGAPERLRWLGEALPVMRGMLHGERPTAAGPRYAAKDVLNLPPP